MKRRLSIGVPGISTTVSTDSPIDIFELMITDELVDIIVEQTNLYFQQNTVGIILKKKHALQDIWRVNMLDYSIKLILVCMLLYIFVYTEAFLYLGVVHKPIYHMYYTNDKIFETPVFRKIISQNRLVLIEKYIHFVDRSELRESLSFIQNSSNTQIYYRALAITFDPRS